MITTQAQFIEIVSKTKKCLPGEAHFRVDGFLKEVDTLCKTTTEMPDAVKAKVSESARKALKDFISIFDPKCEPMDANKKKWRRVLSIAPAYNVWSHLVTPDILNAVAGYVNHIRVKLDVKNNNAKNIAVKDDNSIEHVATANYHLGRADAKVAELALINANLVNELCNVKAQLNELRKRYDDLQKQCMQNATTVRKPSAKK